MKIGIDLDGTLNDIHAKWLSCYNADYNDQMKKEDIKSWDVHEWVKPECGQKIYDYFAQHRFFLDNVDHQPDSVEGMKYLVSKYTVYIITSYAPFACADKVAWLLEHYPFLNSRDIIFCNHKHLVNVDVLIDDAPLFIETFPRRAIVFDASWNQNLGSKYERLFAWSKISELL